MKKNSQPLPPPKKKKLKSVSYIKKDGRTNPSFGMTTTQDIRNFLANLLIKLRDKLQKYDRVHTAFKRRDYIPTNLVRTN